jgi:hypothetical protein
MSFLKNILKPFVEFNPEDENNASQQQGKSQQKNVTTEKVSTSDNAENINTNNITASAASYKSSQPASAAKSAASNDYHTYFENLVEEANAKNPLFQGTDFKEFIDSKIDVEAIADEGTRYKTAFNVLKRTGLTKEKLVTTGQQYINLIEQDLKGFANAFNQQYQSEVEQKEQLLQKKAEELQSLNEKITGLNNEMKQMSQQIVQNKEKLNTNKNSFLSAGEDKKKEIENELQKIDQYF